MTIPERRWNEELAVGEFCWHVSGSKDVNFISHYVRRWRDFSDDGCSIEGSCYGHRIFSRNQGGLSQWESLVKLLTTDPDTRRAVIVLAEPLSGKEGSALDVPCITSIQFLLRSGKLNCHVFMRSNDVIWGMCYDVFFVTMLQEMLACEIGAELGEYVHSCGSVHIYERHFAMANKLLDRYKSGYPEMIESIMEPMVEVESLGSFLAIEREVRLSGVAPEQAVRNLPSFWKQLLMPLLDDTQRRRFA